MNIPAEELSDIAHFQNRKQVPLKSSWGDKTCSTLLFLNFADRQCQQCLLPGCSLLYFSQTAT